MAIAPYPPMPLIIGSTTFRAAATATAASKAFPPSERISSPARVAYGLAELTMPEGPIAGLVGVFCVGCGAPATDVEVVASVGWAARASAGDVVSSPALSPREASSDIEV